MISMIVPTRLKRYPYKVPEWVGEVILADERGVARARNAGAWRAKGAWLLFVDDDSEIVGPRPTLTAHLELPYVYSPVWPKRWDRTDRWVARLKYYADSASNVAHFLPVSIGSGILTSKNAFCCLLGFDENSLIEDVDYGLRYARSGWAWQVGSWVSLVHKPPKGSRATALVRTRASEGRGRRPL